MIQYLQTLNQHRELLTVWTLREIKVRYKQSLLGGTWAVLQPLSLMVMFSIIFTFFVKVPTDGIPYPVFSYVALLPWTFFAAAIGIAASSLTDNMSLVTKIYFPREILPLSAVMARLVDFAIGAVVFVGMLLYYRIPFSPLMMLIPALVLIQLVLIIGISLFLSAINVFYHDVRHLLPLLLQLWMYSTPIIYPTSLVPERFRTIYALNPMASLVEAYRAVALHGQLPDFTGLATATVVSTIIFLFGYLFFKQVEWRFADII